MNSKASNKRIKVCKDSVYVTKTKNRLVEDPWGKIQYYDDIHAKDPNFRHREESCASSTYRRIMEAGSTLLFKKC